LRNSFFTLIAGGRKNPIFELVVIFAEKTLRLSWSALGFVGKFAQIHKLVEDGFDS